MIMNLYREIDKVKIQFDFVVHSKEVGAYDEEIRSLGGMIFTVPRFTGTNLIYYKNAWSKFLSEHEDYKIIHGHIGSSAAIYLGLAKKNGLVTIAHSHSSNFEPTLKGRVYAFFSYPTRFIADYFFACSDIAGVVRYGDQVLKSSRFYMLRNAVKVDDFTYSEHIRNTTRLELGIHDNFVIGHVGRLNMIKNHSFLLHIFKKIYEKNKKAVLVLVGEGELYDEIRQLANELGLSERILFTGATDNVAKMLQAFDVFVFPSLYEGLGISVIEAQAAGLHCVVSDEIPKEAYVTNLIESLSLKNSANVWAEKILRYANGYDRINTRRSLEKNGYDIFETTRWLERFYIEKMDSVL